MLVLLALISNGVVTVDGHVKTVILLCHANPLQEEV